MPEVGQLAARVRSKNAGPFWLTVDVFCGTAPVFERLSRDLTTERVARAFAVEPSAIRRFDIEALHVIKFSLPRPAVQGSRGDRDMHGASWAALIAELEL